MPKAKLESPKTVADFTVKYSAPVALSDSLSPMPPDDDLADDDLADDDLADDDDDDLFQPIAESDKSFVKKLTEAGIVPPRGYALTIAKFPPDSIDSGPRAVKVGCGRFIYTQNELMQNHHMDRVRSFGPGRYWLTLRGPEQKGVLGQWEVFIDAEKKEQIISPITSQNPNQQLQSIQPVKSIDPFDQVDQAIKLVERLEKLRKTESVQPATQPPLDANLAVAKFLMESPATAKQVAKNLIGSSHEPESLLPMLLNNLPALTDFATSLVDRIFSNLAAVQSGQIQPAPQQTLSPIRPITPAVPHFDALSEIADTLRQALLDEALTIEKHNPALYAQRLIDLSDKADQLNAAPVAHYVEMLASATPSVSMPMICLLTKQKIELTPSINAWLEALQRELEKFYDFNSENIAIENS